MKANEFVKKFGWQVAEDIADSLRYGLATDQKFTVIRNMVHRSTEGFTLPELERLIESHDLVEKVGGLSLAKDSYRDFEYIHVGLDLVPCRSLGKAIADVESCNAT